MRLGVAGLCLSIAFGVLATAFSQSAEKGQSVCFQIGNMVNALVEYTQTSCVPTLSKTPGAYSFILMSSKPIFAVEASKKARLLVAVAASGDALNRNPSVRADELWLSDANEMKSRIAYVLPAALAKSLQLRAKANQITLDGMYSEISRNLVRREIPKR